MERYIAIDNVCAWPNLTILPDGAIAAAIYNQPSHGEDEGDVDCWASKDEGRTWKLRGVAAPHEPGTNRMNVAAGLAHDGSLIVLSSGWGGEGLRGHLEPTWVCSSEDGGFTWSHSDEFELPEYLDWLCPFGDIVQMEGQSLAASAYCGQGAVVMFSHDDGKSWGDAAVIQNNELSETTLLRLRPDRWLAASRCESDGRLELHTSPDEGKTWTREIDLTLPSQHPAHLLLLKDGRILLVYGQRNRGAWGLGARFSEDEGRTWSPPRQLVSIRIQADLGYPSCVQTPDGTIVTAYYASKIPEHERYHMGVVRWEPE